ncbi:hypothetical protein V6N11_042983 [Hibiscus sabdariffa]|uniref:Uncharacterized protein n=1 Tax=Hibiscus sabdariffa TaxID=183260 RepID=A0ABR2QYB7_9ROSI
MVVGKKNKRQSKPIPPTTNQSSRHILTTSRLNSLFNVDESNELDSNQPPSNLAKAAIKSPHTPPPSPSKVTTNMKSKHSLDNRRAPSFILGSKNMSPLSIGASSTRQSKEKVTSSPLNSSKHFVVNLVDDANTMVPPSVSIK